MDNKYYSTNFMKRQFKGGQLSKKISYTASKDPFQGWAGKLSKQSKYHYMNELMLSKQ